MPSLSALEYAKLTAHMQPAARPAARNHIRRAVKSLVGPQADPSPAINLITRQTNVQIPEKIAKQQQIAQTDPSDARLDPDLPTPPHAWRHSSNQRLRQRVIQALYSLTKGAARAGRYEQCGDAAYIYRHIRDPEKVRISGSKCGDRLCPTCQRERAYDVRQVLATHCQGKDLSFITLTLRHEKRPLAETITALMTGWRELRRLVGWKTTVHGGTYVTEIKRNERTGLWHCHLHIIVEAKYLPQYELSAMWLSATRTSQIVDIRRVHDVGKQLSYITKYISKPIDGSIFRNPEALAEFAQATRGVRSLGCFGTWRKLKLRDRPPEDDEAEKYVATDWEQVCSIGEFRDLIAAGEPWAVAAQEKLKLDLSG